MPKKSDKGAQKSAPDKEKSINTDSSAGGKILLESISALIDTDGFITDDSVTLSAHEDQPMLDLTLNASEPKAIFEFTEEKKSAPEEQFIIPEEATFSISEPEGIENAEEEKAPEEEKRDELLDIDHFSDYGTENAPSPIDFLKEEVSPFLSEDENKDGEEEENITILKNEEENAEDQLPPPIKQKYEDPDRERYDQNRPRKIDGRFDFLELFVFTLLAVILLTTFVFRHSVVEGPSMQNTLQNGEHLIISNLFYTPEKGDIIVCQDRETGHENPIVKRIIATEGDTIEILPDGRVYVNDELLIEDYVFLDGIDPFMGLEKTTVPEGTVFVMGDHRNRSSDSRNSKSDGPVFVREEAILGKVILRFYPFDRFGKVD